MDLPTTNEDSMRPLRVMLLVVGILVILRLFVMVLVKYNSRDTSQMNLRTVSLIVLGDIGRSPRMQYHAISFAESGFLVDLIGYEGSKPSIKIMGSSRIRLIYIQRPFSILDKAPKVFFPVTALIKVIIQSGLLFFCLLFRARPQQYILVQNPPSIPVLVIAQLVALIGGARLVVDWHNFGYTVLADKLGSNHVLVHVSKMYERIMGRRAFAHLTVTNAMRHELRDVWKVKGRISTLYDRFPEHFHRLDIQETHEFLTRLDLRQRILEMPNGKQWLAPDIPGSTLITRKSAPGNSILFREGRPKIVVSSTSWTPDEDFDILLDAIIKVESLLQASLDSTEQKICFIVTGKGPLKEKFETKISRLSLQRTQVFTMWLSLEDYPRLLGISDLGISLHKSTSGFDLPMKIVDMFGCGLPVCSRNFTCLHELLKEGINGVTFDTAENLANHILELLTTDDGNKKLENMRKSLQEARTDTWKTNWLGVMGRVLAD